MVDQDRPRFAAVALGIVTVGLAAALILAAPASSSADRAQRGLATTAITDSSVVLRWTAPGDDGGLGSAAVYDLRRSLDPITAASFDAATSVPLRAPSAAGTLETALVEGLSPLTTYYFAIRAADETGNWSGISNVVRVTTPAPDTLAPNSITSLVAREILDRSVRLEWNAPGDDGSVGTAAAYDLRWSSQRIDEASFATATPVTLAAPRAAGATESFRMTGLTPGTVYWFAIRARDEARHWSTLGQALRVETLLPDATPPDSVDDLHAGQPTDSSIALTWTAPGDDGPHGNATAYDLRRSAAPITDANFASAVPIGMSTPRAGGSLQSRTVVGLVPNAKYYFAVRTRDDAGNYSRLSNVAQATTTPHMDAVEPAAVNNLAASQIYDSSMLLTWTAPGDDGTNGRAAAYDLRRSAEPITLSNFAAATRVTLPTPAAAGASESFRLTDCKPGTMIYLALRTRDEANNWSLVGNVPAVATTATDQARPAPVRDLRITAGAGGSVTVQWTNTGDDSLYGAASRLDLRYSTSPITAANFGAATSITPITVSGAAGTTQTTTIRNLDAAVTYYFAAKTADDVSNWSALSNVVTHTGTPPELSLSAPMPNPARDHVRIACVLPTSSDVRVEVFDLAGRRMRTLAHATFTPGTTAFVWGLDDDGGQRLPVGLYLIRARLGTRVFTKRLAIVP